MPQAYTVEHLEIEPICRNCQHFVMHYHELMEGFFSELSKGHCTLGRCKARSTTDTCEYYAEKPIVATIMRKGVRWPQEARKE